MAHGESDGCCLHAHEHVHTRAPTRTPQSMATGDHPVAHTPAHTRAHTHNRTHTRTHINTHARTHARTQPYFRDVFPRAGVVAETFETVVTWGRFGGMHDALDSAFDRCVTAQFGPDCFRILTCRFTHVYTDGPAPCAYYDAAADDDDDDDDACVCDVCHHPPHPM
jgi:hypothetical protein